MGFIARIAEKNCAKFVTKIILHPIKSCEIMVWTLLKYKRNAVSGNRGED